MSNIPILGTKKVDEKEPHIRLMICLDCKSIEEIPDYEGDPRGDVLLEVAAEKHEDVTGNRHRGHLMRVPLKYWSQPEAQKQIIGQIKDGAGGLDDVDKGWYDTKSTFHEDAMQCYNKHLRPVAGCPDYKTDAKALRPKTNDARKDLGMTPIQKTKPTAWLCQFCPVSVHYNTKLRELRGMYK